ncbi:MAG: serine/threonine-protein kinase [Pirellulaceae bacterium]|nr:serine/threonine-protein kinase [Pirellulaceae bacterium]
MPTEALTPGVTIANRYTIDREIGRGSFGVVYLAHDAHTREERAIKVLLPWAACNEQLRHRLRREARLAGNLHGPHAVRIYEAGETEAGDVFLSMEYLRGEELNLILRREGPFPPDRVRRIAEQVLAALDEAHRLGVIHRDLKPNNVFLCSGEGGEFVKVFDFGIAKVTGDGQLMATAKLSVSGGVMGTPVYMSPEQCRGEELTPAADFYSLGIVLYELLTRRVPFEDDNPVRVLMMHNHDPVPPLPEGIADTPLGRAIMRSLAKEPGQRFRSAAEFLDALAGREVPLPSATPSPAIAESGKPAPTAETEPSLDEPEPARRSGFSLLMIGGVVVVIIVAAAAAYFALNR